MYVTLCINSLELCFKKESGIKNKNFGKGNEKEMVLLTDWKNDCLDWK